MPGLSQGQPGSGQAQGVPGVQGIPAAPAFQALSTPQGQTGVASTAVTASGNPGQAAALQAKQLVMQYGHDPARLSNELGRLKATYLAAQFGISINPAKN
jgi:hypothetical protein